MGDCPENIIFDHETVTVPLPLTTFLLTKCVPDLKTGFKIASGSFGHVTFVLLHITILVNALAIGGGRVHT